MRSTAQDKHLPVERVLLCQNLHILIHRYNLSLTIINDCINNAKQQINQLLKPTAECTIVHLVYILAENQHIVIQCHFRPSRGSQLLAKSIQLFFILSSSKKRLFTDKIFE